MSRPPGPSRMSGETFLVIVVCLAVVLGVLVFICGIL